MSDKIRVAVYCRVANENDEAIKQQEMKMISFAKKQGYEDITVYSDNGYSGLSFNRPAFIQMEKEIKAGRIGLVICNDVSRISRDTFKMIDWVEMIRRRGALFKTLRAEVTGTPIIDIRKAIHRAYQEHQMQYCAT